MTCDKYLFYFIAFRGIYSNIVVAQYFINVKCRLVAITVYFSLLIYRNPRTMCAMVIKCNSNGCFTLINKFRESTLNLIRYYNDRHQAELEYCVTVINFIKISMKTLSEIDCYNLQ